MPQKGLCQKNNDRKKSVAWSAYSYHAGLEKHRMTMALESEALAFLEELGIFDDSGEGVRQDIQIFHIDLKGYSVAFST